MSSISSFDIISVLVCHPKIFSYIPSSTADAAVVNPKGLKTVLASGLITFLIRSNPVFSNGPRSLRRMPPDCII